MATRIKIKRGTKSSIIANKATLEENEIVYSTDSFQLAIRNSGAPGGLAWQVAKDAYNVIIGSGATNANNEYGNIIIGNEAYSASEFTVAIGNESSIGTNANYSTAIGAWANVSTGTLAVPNEYAIAIGYNAKVTSHGGIALGQNSIVASNPYSVVIGRGSQNVNTSFTTAEYASVIIGGNSISGSDGKNIIIGGSSSSSDSNNIIIGNDVLSDYNSLVIGHNNDVSHLDSTIVIGHGASAGASANHVQLGNSSFISGNIGNYPINLVGKMSGSGTMETTTNAETRRFRLSELNLSSLPINTKVFLWIIPGTNGTTREVRTTNVNGSIVDIKYTLFVGDFNTSSNGNYMRAMPLTILIEKLTSTTASVDIVNMPMGLTTTSVSVIVRDPDINISTGNITFKGSGITAGNAIYYKWVVL